MIARNTNLSSARTPSRLELTYLQSASDLAQMIAEGRFPFPGEEPDMDALAARRRRPDPARRRAGRPTPARTPSRPTTAWAWPADLVGHHLGETTAELATPASRWTRR